MNKQLVTAKHDRAMRILRQLIEHIEEGGDIDDFYASRAEIVIVLRYAKGCAVDLGDKGTIIQPLASGEPNA